MELKCLSTQIQCVLQDVGSHVATPRDAATKNKLGQCSVLQCSSSRMPLDIKLPIILCSWYNIVPLEWNQFNPRVASLGIPDCARMTCVKFKIIYTCMHDQECMAMYGHNLSVGGRCDYSARHAVQYHNHTHLCPNRTHTSLCTPDCACMTHFEVQRQIDML